MGSTAKWRGQRKESVNWNENNRNYPNGMTASIQSEKKKKVNRASGTFRTIKKALTFMSLECWVEKRKGA